MKINVFACIYGLNNLPGGNIDQTEYLAQDAIDETVVLVRVVREY